ncbi:hypothetical protein CBL_12186 [Carabus blaptoides fortunei]
MLTVVHLQHTERETRHQLMFMGARGARDNTRGPGGEVPRPLSHSCTWTAGLQVQLDATNRPLKEADSTRVAGIQWTTTYSYVIGIAQNIAENPTDTIAH